jgi:addiction module RelE/StbE family toxin
VRQVRGYHDEPLMGKLRDVRSVRLGRSYRLYYRIIESSVVETVLVEEINRHDYKEIERLFER